MACNTTGAYNVAVGANAGLLHSTGGNNIFVGDSAGRQNTTGCKNTGLGSGALYGAGGSGTVMQDNAAVGYRSLYTNTTGNSNAAFGNNTLYANTTGCINTAIGKDALGLTTTGQQNTALGAAAGYNVTTGDNNLLVGRNAGRSQSPATITTGDNNIVLGNNTHTNAYIKIDWTVTSDLRDKTNIEPIPHGLNFINQITPIKYNFKKSRENETSHGKARFGFKAQEILALEGDNPVLVNNEDTDSLKLTGAYLVPVLVKAIQELKARIEVLENE